MNIDRNRRVDPEITEKLETELIYYRGAIAEAQETLKLKDHKGWQIVCKSITDHLTSIETQLDNFEKLSERELILRLKERKDFRWVVSLVEKVEDNLRPLINSVATLEKQLDERKRTPAAH